MISQTVEPTSLLSEYGLPGVFIACLIWVIIWGTKQFKSTSVEFTQHNKEQVDRFLSSTEKQEDRHRIERLEWQERDDKRFDKIMNDLSASLKKKDN